MFREHAPSELISNLANLFKAHPHGMMDPHSETEAIENYRSSFFKLRKMISAGSGFANICAQKMLFGASSSVTLFRAASARAQP